MAYVIKSWLHQPITCSLADNSTLCLANFGSEKKITDGQITDHIKYMEELGYVDITAVDVKGVVVKAQKVERKGGKDNGDTIKT